MPVTRPARVLLATALALAALTVWAVLPAAASAAPTVVSLTFDGGLSGHSSIAAQLDARGLDATFFVNSGDVGTTGHLSWSQLWLMQSAGHEIGGMTTTNAWLPGLPDAQAKHEICDDRDALLSHGLRARSFAYPYRDATPDNEAMVEDCGYASGRGGGGWYDDTLPPRNPYFTLTPEAATASTSLADLQQQVTDTIADGAGWTTFQFDATVDPTVLKSFFDWLVTQRQAGEIVVQTVGSAIGGTLMPPRNLPEDRTVVSINFDDGLIRQKAAADAMAARGLRGTFYVNSGTIGKSGYLSWNDLASMQTVGHEIGSHTQHHPDLRALTPDQQRTEICGDRNALVSKGLTITSFAYPSSWWTDELQSVVAGCGGFETARTVGGIQCTACTYAETQPPGNRWVVDTADQVLSGTSLSTLQRYVTTVESLGGGWVPIVFHDICDGCGAYGYSSATFTAFLDWLKTRPSTTVVRTMREAMAGADVTAPTVSVTAPTYTSRRSKVTLKAAATDSGSGVARVTFLVDGAVLATDTTSPYSATWDPKNARLGWHDVAARVDDRAGNTATSRTVRIYVSF